MILYLRKFLELFCYTSIEKHNASVAKLGCQLIQSLLKWLSQVFEFHRLLVPCARKWFCFIWPAVGVGDLQGRWRKPLWLWESNTATLNNLILSNISLVLPEEFNLSATTHMLGGIQWFSASVLTTATCSWLFPTSYVHVFRDTSSFLLTSFLKSQLQTRRVTCQFNLCLYCTIYAVSMTNLFAC